MASPHLNDSCAGSGMEHESFGQYRDSLYIVIPVTVVYAFIFLTGIVDNVSTCIVIARNKSVHTATNYYLFSLAMSDLLLLVAGLPAEVYMVWCKYPYIFGEDFCVLRGLAAETSTNASVLTIAAFTVERYVAICYPFLSQTLSKLSRAIKLILVIWLVALSFALPQALQFGVVRHRDNPDLVMCTVKRIIITHSFELSTFLFFVLPMCLITVLYALIGLKLRRSNMMKNVPGSVESARNCRRHPGRSSRRVLKMLGEQSLRVLRERVIPSYFSKCFRVFSLACRDTRSTSLSLSRLSLSLSMSLATLWPSSAAHFSLGAGFDSSSQFGLNHSYISNRFPESLHSKHLFYSKILFID